MHVLAYVILIPVLEQLYSTSGTRRKRARGSAVGLVAVYVLKLNVDKVIMVSTFKCQN